MQCRWIFQNRGWLSCLVAACVVASAAAGERPARTARVPVRAATSRVERSVVTLSRPFEAALDLSPGDSQQYQFVFIGGGQYQFVIADELGQSYSVTWTYTDFTGTETQTNTMTGGGELTIGIDVRLVGTFQASIENLAEVGEPDNTYTITVHPMTP